MFLTDDTGADAVITRTAVKQGDDLRCCPALKQGNAAILADEPEAALQAMPVQGAFLGVAGAFSPQAARG